LVLVRARSYIRWAGLPLEDCANELAAGSLHDLYGADVARGRGLRSRRVLVHRLAGSARRAASSGRVGWVETAPMSGFCDFRDPLDTVFLRACGGLWVFPGLAGRSRAPAQDGPGGRMGRP